jgi:D-amino-acid dehydrogenase
MHRWSGLRPCAPDGLPIVGRPRAYDNLVLATGHAMMGFTLAPVTGELVADFVAGTAPSFDLTLLDPDRFRGLRSFVPHARA